MKSKKPMTTEKFFDLMRGRNDKNRVSLDREINAECGAEMTVVCCDSSGFSKKTHEHGIIEFMDNMTKCHDGLKLVVEQHGGTVLSDKADNLMLLFPEPQKAVACAVEMHRWLRKRNKDLPDQKKYNMCIGVHHGALLRFADDAYGAAVNVAFKLGEDVAGKDELLVTGEVNAVVCGMFDTEYSKNVTIGAVEFDVYKVNYK